MVSKEKNPVNMSLPNSLLKVSKSYFTCTSTLSFIASIKIGYESVLNEKDKKPLYNFCLLSK